MTQQVELPARVLDAVKAVLAKGCDAKVSLDRHGEYHVYEEKVKKVPLEAPRP